MYLDRRLSICLFVLAPILAAASETTWNLQKHTIEAPGISASYIVYGARLANVFVPDKNGVLQDVVLGYDKGSQYINDTENEHTYFGAASKCFLYTVNKRLVSVALH